MLRNLDPFTSRRLAISLSIESGQSIAFSRPKLKAHNARNAEMHGIFSEENCESHLEPHSPKI